MPAEYPVSGLPDPTGHDGEVLTATGGAAAWAAPPSGYSDEQARDAVAAMIANGTHAGITFTYDDPGDRLSALVAGATPTATYARFVGAQTSNYTAPDASALDITGKIDVRCRVLPDQWQTSYNPGAALVTKWRGTGNQRSWAFIMDKTAKLSWQWTSDGSTARLITSGTSLNTILDTTLVTWLRVVAEPTAGAGSKARATFYWGLDGTNWNLIDTVDHATAAGPWFSGNADVIVGADESVSGPPWFVGRYYKAQVYDNVTLVASFDATALNATTPNAYTDPQGNVWSPGATAQVKLDLDNYTPPTGAVLGWYDVRDYGAKLNLKRATVTMTAGSPTATGTFASSNGDAGKAIVVVGAGTVLATASDGAMSTSVVKDKNLLTSASASFNRGMVGRTITITGVGAAGATLKTKVWGVVSATQIRVKNWAVTSATGVTYTISDDLYTTITASSNSSATLNANAATAVTAAEAWYATDDAAAIQLAITTAEASQGGNGYTIYLAGKAGICTGLVVTKPGAHFQGQGGRGYSPALQQGTSRLKPLARGLVVITVGSATSKMSVRGSMTSGSATLTDPTANFAAGDVGKAIYVWGAAAIQTSSTQRPLITTISSINSTTSVQLAATAGQTIADTVYDFGASGGIVYAGPTFDRLAIEGLADQVAGMHIMGVGGVELSHVSISGFSGGVALFSCRGANWNLPTNLHNCDFVDCFKHIMAFGGGMTFGGYNNIDGNQNLVGPWPGPGTTGIQFVSIICGSGPMLNVQAVETWGIFDGDSMLDMYGLRLEACPVGPVIGCDGPFPSGGGNKGSRMTFVSMNDTNLGSNLGVGLKLLAGVTDFYFDPGNVYPNDIDMYGQCDATSLLGLTVFRRLIRKVGAVSDADYDRAPLDGEMAIDETPGANKLYVKVAGSWKSTALT